METLCELLEFVTYLAAWRRQGTMTEENTRLSIVKFNGMNWASWSEDLENFLAIREARAWKMIKNGVPRGAGGAIAPEDEEIAGRARAYVYLTCDKAVQKDLAGIKDPKEAFDTLKEIYQSKLSLRSYLLESEWDSLAKKPNETLEQYFARAFDIRAQLEDVDVAKTESSVVNTLLRGLPKVYAPIKTIILNLDASELTVAKVKPRLLAFEADLDGGDRGDAKAYLAGGGHKKKRSSNVVCWNCGEKGHVQAECKKEPKKEHAMTARAAPWPCNEHAL